MSWSGQYTLHVRCDGIPPNGRRLSHQEVMYAEFTSQTAGGARNAARRAGWMIGVTDRSALCPDCRVRKFTEPVDSNKSQP